MSLPTQCPVCREAFRDPRELPCTHVFCFKCVEEVDLAFKRTERPTTRTCPICRIALPDDLTALPKGKVAAIAGVEHSDRPVSNVCTAHSGHVIVGVCDKCHCLVCEQCCEEGNKHAGHTVIDIDEAVAKFTPRGSLLPLVEVLRLRVPAIDHALGELTTMNSTLRARLALLNDEIAAAFLKVSQVLSPLDAETGAALDARRDALLAQAKAGIDEDTATVTKQVRNLKISRDQAFMATRQVDTMVAQQAYPSGAHPFETMRLHALVFDRINFVTPLEPELNVWNRDTLRFRFPQLDDVATIKTIPIASLGDLQREQ